MTFGKVTFSSWAADESLHETQVYAVRINYFFAGWGGGSVGGDISVSQNETSTLAFSHKPKRSTNWKMRHWPYALQLIRLSLWVDVQAVSRL